MNTTERKKIYDESVKGQRQSVKSAAERYNNNLQRPLQLYGTDTGHHDLNMAINGWVPGKITTYAARSGSSKTGMFVQAAKAAGRVQDGRRSQLLFFSWEATAADLVDRYVCWATGLTAGQLKYPKILSPEQNRAIQLAYAEAQSFPVEYQQKPLSLKSSIELLDEFVERCGKKSIVEDVKIQPVMWLDYISMIKGSSGYGNKTYDMADYIQGIKNFAESAGIAVVLLAQLQRSSDSKELPDISDILDSSSVEINSDTVVVATRPEQLRRETLIDPETGATIPSFNKIIWRVLKNREGECGDYLLNCDVARNRFWNRGVGWDSEYWKQYENANFWKRKFKIS